VWGGDLHIDELIAGAQVGVGGSGGSLAVEAYTCKPATTCLRAGHEQWAQLGGCGA